MKLVIAVIQNTDSDRLRQALTEHKFQSTRLASTGGFLREGSTTYLIGVKDDEVEQVKALIAQTCRQRSKMMPMSTQFDMYAEAIEVTVGGAVIFVVPLDELSRL